MYDLQKVKQEMYDAAEAKRNDLNMNVERWKQKFLFPFADIAPLPDKPQDLNTGSKTLGESNDINFQKLVSKKYMYPLDKIHKPEWLREL